MRLAWLLLLLPAIALGADAPAAFAVPSPFRLPAGAGEGTLRYRMQVPPGFFVPETGEQRVRASGPLTEITVCRDCGREAPPDAATLVRMRAPNAWVQSDDPVLRALGRQAGAGTLARRMDRLIDAVRRRLDGPVDYTGYLGAREAWDARRGDCTEYAVLLAAGARAAGIPARVVAGLAYGSRFVDVPHAFGPHAWVQAWDGRRWVSFDAGLPRFDARHVALAIGDGSPEDFGAVMDAIRGLRIDRVARVRD